MKISSLKRGTHAGRGRSTAKLLDFGELFTAIDKKLLKTRVWVQVGIVAKPPGADTHFFIEDGAIFVDVVTQPDGLDLTCRLGSCAGGAGIGLWAIPPEGTEVIVVMPSGKVDFIPTIIATTPTGTPHERTAENRTILVATEEIEIIAPKVRLGPSPGDVDDTLDGFVHGRGIDSFTGATYTELQNTSSKVLGNK